jgi:predicted MFS family arabinose efflux permease
MQTRNQAGPLILALSLAGFAVMADNWVVSPLLPAIARRRLDSRAGRTADRRLYAAFRPLPAAVWPVADGYGKLPVLRASFIGFTLAAGATALGASLTDLALYRALNGAFAAATMPISLALLGDVVRMEDRQAAVGTFLGTSFLGRGLPWASAGPSPSS